ncbi:unnamed protein product [Pedinophyceae sp. YPF-701]|nr:unnamed protein product [Pedinophyceae sp. YPF-701]
MASHAEEAREPYQTLGAKASMRSVVGSRPSSAGGLSSHAVERPRKRDAADVLSQLLQQGVKFIPVSFGPYVCLVFLLQTFGGVLYILHSLRFAWNAGAVCSNLDAPPAPGEHTCHVHSPACFLDFRVVDDHHATFHRRECYDTIKEAYTSIFVSPATITALVLVLLCTTGSLLNLCEAGRRFERTWLGEIGAVLVSLWCVPLVLEGTSGAWINVELGVPASFGVLLALANAAFMTPSSAPFLLRWIPIGLVSVSVGVIAGVQAWEKIAHDDMPAARPLFAALGAFVAPYIAFVASSWMLFPGVPVLPARGLSWLERYQCKAWGQQQQRRLQSAEVDNIPRAALAAAIFLGLPIIAGIGGSVVLTYFRVVVDLYPALISGGILMMAGGAMRLLYIACLLQNHVVADILPPQASAALLASAIRDQDGLASVQPDTSRNNSVGHPLSDEGSGTPRVKRRMFGSSMLEAVRGRGKDGNPTDWSGTDSHKQVQSDNGWAAAAEGPGRRTASTVVRWAEQTHEYKRKDSEEDCRGSTGKVHAGGARAKPGALEEQTMLSASPLAGQAGKYMSATLEELRSDSDGPPLEVTQSAFPGHLNGAVGRDAGARFKFERNGPLFAGQAAKKASGFARTRFSKNNRNSPGRPGPVVSEDAVEPGRNPPNPRRGLFRGGGRAKVHVSQGSRIQKLTRRSAEEGKHGLLRILPWLTEHEPGEPNSVDIRKWWKRTVDSLMVTLEGFTRAGQQLTPGTMRPALCKRDHAEVTVVFSDIVGYTKMSSTRPGSEVLDMLNEYFGRLDKMTDQIGVYKVETVGDAYVVACNLFEPDEFHQVSAVLMAEAMLRVAATIPAGEGGEGLRIRVGIHTGALTTGVVGQKRKLVTLVGDTMNTAARMEQHSRPGCIRVSDATFHGLPEALQEFFVHEHIEAKGKGRMDTYMFTPGITEHGADDSAAAARKLAAGTSMLHLLSAKRTGSRGPNRQSLELLRKTPGPSKRFSIDRMSHWQNQAVPARTAARQRFNSTTPSVPEDSS